MRALVFLSVSLLVSESGLASARPADGTDISELARPDATMTSPAEQAITQEPADDVVQAVRSRLTESYKASAASDDVEAARAFYARARHPLWIRGSEWSPRAIAVIGELKRADDWGLDASAFDIPVLAPASGDEIADTAALADAELKLSLAALWYARDARGGRISDPAGQLSAYIDRAPQLRPPLRVLSELAAASAPDRYLRGLNPQYVQFEKLRRRYVAMRDGDSTSSPNVPEDGPTIVAGTLHPDVAVIRERLRVPAASEPELYDDELVAVIEDFQRLHGLAADGVIGPRTRRALNGQGGVSQQSILANMEEWRWMPEDLGGIYVWVNVPEFVVRVVKDGKVIHTAPVVVGKTATPTPIFSKDLKTIYFRPRWYIPDSIKANEIWPRLRRGGARGYQILRNGQPISSGSVNWSRADVRNYVVFQPPGPGNALGLVKFTFPNKHSVYMHDTPSKGLFSSSVRAFSHGCIRVKDPDQLAKVLLSIDQGTMPDTVDELMQSGPDNNAIELGEHIPVHITYFTAWADENGEIATAPDIYGHEKRISLALQGQWGEIDKTAPAAVAYAGPSVSDWGGDAPKFFSPASSSAAPRGNTANDIFRRGFGN